MGASSTVNAFLAHAGSLPSVKEIALTVSLACFAALVLLTGTGSSTPWLKPYKHTMNTSGVMHLLLSARSPNQLYTAHGSAQAL